MSQTTSGTRYMVQLALMIALVVVVAFVPFLGFIPLVVIKATTVHIPVIIGAILMGPKAGALLGLTMGVTSIIKNTLEPAVVSFVFSPFVPVPGQDGGDLRSLLIALVPRMLIGVVAGLSYRLLSHVDRRGYMACGMAAFLGSFTNTMLVMGGIYLIFGAEYAAASNIAFETLGVFILGVVATNGIAEAAVAVVICVFIVRPLKSVFSPVRKTGRYEQVDLPLSDDAVPDDQDDQLDEGISTQGLPPVE